MVLGTSIGAIFAYGLLKKRLEGVYIWENMVVTHHFLSRDRPLGFLKKQCHV